jgi:hypothetical protein
MLLRDLVRACEPVRVWEKSGSQGLRRWDRIATRLIPLRDRAVISGTLPALDRDTSEALPASLGRVRNQAPRDVAVVACELGLEADAERLAGILTPDMLLSLGAFLVTNFWLDAALKSAQDADQPEMLNTDGDPLEFTTLHFPLLPGVAAPTLRAALATIPALRLENAGFWNWLAEPGAKTQTEPRLAIEACVCCDHGGWVARARHGGGYGPAPVAGCELIRAPQARPGLAGPGAGGPDAGAAKCASTWTKMLADRPAPPPISTTRADANQ